ncbi:hypothetical protein J9978_22255 [Chromobacterium violaceum]|uniref:hypothetical protein n=1 Tax=Chromobacterium violaceum TaxID=536 RepID=UPI001B32C94A|nr:hypothetical protein [Chromobacterium violaceum]MBP4052195.1 hypothetical protein [Chromobacterium violaceum]
MRARKSFAAPPPVKVATVPPQAPLDDATSLVIPLPENPSGLRSLDLIPWLSRGIDAWVWVCAGQLRAFLASREVTPTTVAGYWSDGLRYFFEFLTTVGGPADPAQLEPRHIRLYLGWLAEQGWAYRSQKVKYDIAKSVLTALTRRQIVPDQAGLFPVNPFPKSNSRSKGASPLSSSERVQLAQALRDDLVAIHQGNFDGPDSAALVVHLLAVAIRTGANTTPLLEASRDCLRPHPFMPNMMRLELFKRRGNATKLLQLRYSKQDDLSLSVPMDGVALIRKVLKLSEPLLVEATPEHRNRVWLYRAEKRSGAAGKVIPLTDNTLEYGIARLIERHNLCTDDGEPLRLNLTRLRKTLEHRLFDLSGGDLIATAEVMGHTPKVADTHYLACTQQMRENATFVGEALPDIYRAGEDGKTVSPIVPSQSPTGRCKDPYQGDKAPKNGEPCDDFFSCFACTSYAIVGSPEDLHRLFSFYFFLERELHHAKTEDWRTEFRHTMNLIDRFTSDTFDPSVVAAARERARLAPLKFWASYVLSEGAAYG